MAKMLVAAAVLCGGLLVADAHAGGKVVQKVLVVDKYGKAHVVAKNHVVLNKHFQHVAVAKHFNSAFLRANVYGAFVHPAVLVNHSHVNGVCGLNAYGLNCGFNHGVNSVYGGNSLYGSGLYGSRAFGACGY